MVRHIFLWKLAEGADPETVIQLLNELPERLPGTLSWSLGPHQGEPGSSGGVWDYGLVCDFESFEALKRYSEDPFHMQCIERLLPMFADRAVCDFEIPE